MTDTFEASLVRVGQLQQANRGNGDTNSYMYITVARNYQRLNRDTNKWEEQGTIFQDCSLNGKTAELFAQGNYQPGTLLLISGRKSFIPKQSFQSKKTGEMIERPETESILVESIGAVIGRWQKPIVEKSSGNSQSSQTQNNTQQTQNNNFNDNDILNEQPVNSNSVDQDSLFDFDGLD